MPDERREKPESPRWWTVRGAQNLKPATYRCPFCHRFLPLTERNAGRLPSRDEWLRTQPRRPGLLRRLLGRTS
jgi:hypothetical protein